MNNNNMEIGKSYIFFIPPGWLLGGTIVSVEEKTVVVKDCVYLEQVREGGMLSVAFCKTADELKKAISSSYPIPDGMVLRTEAALILVPCARDFTPLSRQGAEKAIKGVR